MCSFFLVKKISRVAAFSADCSRRNFTCAGHDGEDGAAVIDSIDHQCVDQSLQCVRQKT
jgi:hypothetical protein